MTAIIETLVDSIFTISLNRIEKHNAFDEEMIGLLQEALDKAINHTKVRVIILKANGKHFSLGADLNWMQRTVALNEQENFEDALALGKVLYTLYHCPKPTIAVVQGSAFGGGAGLVAACDSAIASPKARFCFSEVKLGLIPALISPYVIEAIGKRTAQWLFMSAQAISAEEALRIKLIQELVDESNLEQTAFDYGRKIIQNAPLAVLSAKALVQDIAFRPIDQTLMEETAHRIAQKRVSTEGQLGLKAFLNKETPPWN